VPQAQKGWKTLDEGNVCVEWPSNKHSKHILRVGYASARCWRGSCCSILLCEYLGDYRAYRVLQFVRARVFTPSCFETSENTWEFWRWS